MWNSFHSTTTNKDFGNSKRIVNFVAGWRIHQEFLPSNEEEEEEEEEGEEEEEEEGEEEKNAGIVAAVSFAFCFLAASSAV